MDWKKLTPWITIKRKGAYEMNNGRRLVAIAALLFFSGLAALPAQAVQTLAEDLSDFLQQAGREFTPHQQSGALTSLEAGSAQIGGFPHMYFSFGLGAMFTDGIANVVDGDYTIDLEGILQDEIGGNSSYDLIRSFLPLPVARLTYGIGLTRGFEANVQLMTIPSALISSVGPTGVSFGLTNLGGRVRKTVMEDGPTTPAVAVGVGYVYSNFNLGYELKELGSVDVGATTINLSGGELTYEMVTNSAGIDVRLSEQVGPIIPFIGVASWYQWSSFEGGVDGLAGDVGGSAVGPVDELRSFDDNDLNSVVTAGVDLKLGAFVFFLEGSYAFSTQAPAAYTGFRLQF